jgi:nicotinamidase-related amidase
VQRDTLDGQPLEVPGTTTILPTIALLCAAFRAAGRPVVHIVRLYLADGSNAEACRKDAVRRADSMLTPGTSGRLLASELLAGAADDLDDDLLLGGGVQVLDNGDLVVFKPRWGAFFQTPLENRLRAAAVDTTVFVGCNFPNCPRTSIYEASERDFHVLAVGDAISGLYPQGVQELRGIGVEVLEATDVAHRLGIAT